MKEMNHKTLIMKETNHKTWSISALGLSDKELTLLKSLAGLTSARNGDRYSVNAVNYISECCNILILNPDDREALEGWQVLASNPNPPTAVLFTTTPPDDPDQHYLLRPFGPTKLLALLDGIVKKLHEAEHAWGDPTSSPAAAASTPATELQALVVDDSPTVCKQLELELRNFNIRSDVAETGERGLELLRLNNYDIIFLDVVLPGTDGYQVCKEIRKDPKTRQTPVIMLTSKSSPFDRVRGMLVGCSAYLTKPVDFKLFSETVTKYTGTQGRP